MIRLLGVMLAVLAGAALSVQLGPNTQLRERSGEPAWAALVSFGSGSIALAAYLVFARIPWPPGSRFAGAGWWIWTGGLLGAVYMVSVIFLAPRLGPTLLFSSVIAGQVIASLVIEQFGWMGFTARPITPGRAMGASLLFLAVWMIRRF